MCKESTFCYSVTWQIGIFFPRSNDLAEKVRVQRVTCIVQISFKVAIAKLQQNTGEPLVSKNIWNEGFGQYCYSWHISNSFYASMILRMYETKAKISTLRLHCVLSFYFMRIKDCYSLDNCLRGLSYLRHVH